MALGFFLLLLLLPIADIRSSVLPSRNLRSTKKGKENALILNHRAKKLNPSHINYTLKETEIGEDLALIQKALISRDRTKANEIFVERSQLHYFEKVKQRRRKKSEKDKRG
jgi:hypothetical protein